MLIAPARSSWGSPVGVPLLGGPIEPAIAGPRRFLAGGAAAASGAGDGGGPIAGPAGGGGGPSTGPAGGGGAASGAGGGAARRASSARLASAFLLTAERCAAPSRLMLASISARLSV